MSGVKGVNIASKGDQYFLHNEKFYEVQVPANHAIFTDTKPANISVGKDLPFIVHHRYGNYDPAWEETARNATPAFLPMQNRTAMYLMNVDAHIRNKKWPFVDLTVWDPDLGTVLVVRQDKKDITPQQVEALCRFCRNELGPRVDDLEKDLYADGDPTEEQAREARKRFIGEHMCKEKFETYFEKLKKEKTDAGNKGWGKAVSPFSV